MYSDISEIDVFLHDGDGGQKNIPKKLIWHQHVLGYANFFHSGKPNGGAGSQATEKKI